jgi:hypothetical protein
MDVCVCGRVIEHPAPGRRRKKCSVCSPVRERHNASRRAPVIKLPEKPAQPGGPGLATALEREHPAASSALAMLAHLLAVAMVEPQHGADIAALSRELRALLGALEGSSKGRSDALDELRSGDGGGWNG